MAVLLGDYELFAFPELVEIFEAFQMDKNLLMPPKLPKIPFKKSSNKSP
jgi:hypothetical protein